MSEYCTPLVVGNNIAELPKSTLPASAADNAGHYPFFCSSAEVKATTTWLQDKPTVLMGTGGVASVNYGEDMFAYSTDTWGFRSNNPKLSTKFLLRKIQQYLPRINYAGFEGSGLRHLRKGYVKKLIIDIPSPTVQSRIVEILDSYDRAIEKTEALIAKYQQIKAGLMHDLFTRGITADGKLRPPRDQAPELYQETPIGWIPKKWEVKPLGKIASFQRGHDIVETQFKEGPFPVVSSSGVIGFHSMATTKSPNVIVGRKGNIGKVHFLEHDFWAHDTSLFVTNFFGNDVRFIYYLCLYLDLARFGTRSGSPSLNRNDIHPILVGLPKTDEQVRIWSLIDRAVRFLESEKIQLSKLRSQKLGLMHDLLTGKIAVTPISAKPEAR